MQLLLGCGRSRQKKVVTPGCEAWDGLVTLDINPDVGPDVVHDLSANAPLPFSDDCATEIHIYDVLEHIGAQGDWQALFRQFAELWRVAAPGATLHAVVPWWQSRWAWADPGHTRVIQPETLTFLDQGAYIAELDGEQRTNRTDYRRWYRADWTLAWSDRLGEGGEAFAFVLRAVKPSRWVDPARHDTEH